MELEYEVGIDDLVAMSWNYSSNSEVMKRSSNTETFSTAVSVLLFFGLLALVTDNIRLLIAGFVVSLMWVFLWPRMQQRGFTRKQKAMYSELPNRSLVGRKVMEFEDDLLSERSELHWSQTKLSAIERIDITDNHAFITLGTNQGFVIPRVKVRDGNYGEFVSSLRKRVKTLLEESVPEKAAPDVSEETDANVTPPDMSEMSS